MLDGVVVRWHVVGTEVGDDLINVVTCDTNYQYCICFLVALGACLFKAG